MVKKVLLIQMNLGERGEIIEIRGGIGISLRLERLGIRIGEKIKKISQQIMQGPVVIKVGKSQIAIGFSMATRIIVEVTKELIDENSSTG